MLSFIRIEKSESVQRILWICLQLRYYILIAGEHTTDRGWPMGLMGDLLLYRLIGKSLLSCFLQIIGKGFLIYVCVQTRSTFIQLCTFLAWIGCFPQPSLSGYLTAKYFYYSAPTKFSIGLHQVKRVSPRARFRKKSWRFFFLLVTMIFSHFLKQFTQVS